MLFPTKLVKEDIAIALSLVNEDDNKNIEVEVRYEFPGFHQGGVPDAV